MSRQLSKHLCPDECNRCASVCDAALFRMLLPLVLSLILITQNNANEEVQLLHPFFLCSWASGCLIPFRLHWQSIHNDAYCISRCVRQTVRYDGSVSLFHSSSSCSIFIAQFSENQNNDVSVSCWHRIRCCPHITPDSVQFRAQWKTIPSTLFMGFQQ